MAATEPGRGAPPAHGTAGDRAEATPRHELLRDFEALAHIGSWERTAGRADSTWSPGMYRILGLDPSIPADARRCRGLIHPGDRDHFRDAMGRLVREREPFSLELRIVRPDGEMRQLVALGRAEPAPRCGDGPRLFGMVQDVTDHRRVQVQRARLLARTLEVADRERRRLAARVHDDIIQELSVAMLVTEALRGRFEEDELERLREPIRTAAGHLRNLLADLAPPDVTAEEFEPAVRDYVEVVLGDRVDTTVDLSVPAPTAPPTLSTALRIIREAVANIGRHAEAEHAEIRVGGDDRELVGRVRDDGVGFEPDKLPKRPGHIGLQVIRDRSRDLNGDLTIESVPGEGTTITFRLPRSPVLLSR